jgi:hypothetical protein
MDLRRLEFSTCLAESVPEGHHAWSNHLHKTGCERKYLIVYGVVCVFVKRSEEIRTRLKSVTQPTACATVLKCVYVYVDELRATSPVHHRFS